MKKQDLIDNGFIHITTQNCEQKTEVWAKFSGYLDTIQYHFYLPLLDETVSNNVNTSSYLQLDMLAQIRDKMRNDFVKKDIQYDTDGIWSNKKNSTKN